MSLTANQARSLAIAARTADIEEVYSAIEVEAKKGNSVLLLNEAIDYDVKTSLTTNGYTVSNPTPSSTQISWASVTA